MTNQCLKLYVTVRLLFHLGPIAQWLKNGKVVQLYLLNNLEVLGGKGEKIYCVSKTVGSNLNSWHASNILLLLAIPWIKPGFDWCDMEEYQKSLLSNILQYSKNNMQLSICLHKKLYRYFWAGSVMLLDIVHTSLQERTCFLNMKSKNFRVAKCPNFIFA